MRTNRTGRVWIGAALLVGIGGVWTLLNLEGIVAPRRTQRSGADGETDPVERNAASGSLARHDGGTDEPSSDIEGADLSNMPAEEARARLTQALDELELGANEARERRLARTLGFYVESLTPSIDDATRRRLVALLTRVRDRARGLIGAAIGKAGADEETSRRLLELFDKSVGSTPTRHAILSALAGMPAPEALPHLMRALADSQTDEARIVRAIGKLGSSSERKTLLHKLGADPDMSDNVRREIEQALANGRDPSVLDAVADRLRLAGAAERQSLLRILMESRTERHAPLLGELMREFGPESRRVAIRALGRFQTLESSRVLLATVESGYPNDRVDAARELLRIRDSRMLDRLAGEVSNLGPESRRALLAAGANNAPRANLIAIGLTSLESREHEERAAAAALLGASRRNEVIDPLVALFRRGDKDDRRAVLDALLEIKTKTALRQGLATLQLLSDSSVRSTYEARFRERLDIPQR